MDKKTNLYRISVTCLISHCYWVKRTGFKITEFILAEKVGWEKFAVT